MEITLRKLELNDFEGFKKAVDANWEKDFIFAHYWETSAKRDFKFYLKLLREKELGVNLDDGHVPSTLLFAFNMKNEIVGRASIRHELNPHLLRVAGHIGYGVVPEFRRKGIATKILESSIEYCKKTLNMNNAILVTCDDNNIGSIKTIEKNKGILEDKIYIGDHSIPKRRYWIKI